MEYEIIGAIKIKDGLFLGDEFAAQVPNAEMPILFLTIVLESRILSLLSQIKLLEF